MEHKDGAAIPTPASTTSPTTAAPEEGKLAASWMSSNMPDGFTLVAVGDLIITDAIHARLQRQSPELVALLKNADVTFGNFEGTAIDLQKFGGHPSALAGGSWLISTRRLRRISGGWDST